MLLLFFLSFRYLRRFHAGHYLHKDGVRNWWVFFFRSYSSRTLQSPRDHVWIFDFSGLGRSCIVRLHMWLLDLPGPLADVHQIQSLAVIISVMFLIQREPATYNTASFLSSPELKSNSGISKTKNSLEKAHHIKKRNGRRRQRDNISIKCILWRTKI